MSNFNNGDKVSPRQSIEGYYSNYGGNPKIEFSPDTVGIIANTKVPCVRGRRPYFMTVDFFCEATGRIERASVFPEQVRRVR